MSPILLMEPFVTIKRTNHVDNNQWCGVAWFKILKFLMLSKYYTFISISTIGVFLAISEISLYIKFTFPARLP